MLRKVEKFTTEQWDNEYTGLRKHTNEFRQEIRALLDKQDALTAISKLDGYISLFTVIAILDEIKAINESAIHSTFYHHTEKDLSKLTIKGSMREIFLKVLGKDIRVIFDELINNTRMHDLTEEKVKLFIFDVADQLYNKAIKKHVNDDLAVENTFKSLLINEIFLLCAGELYKEADDRQTAGWRITFLMGPYLLKTYKEEALQNPFIVVRECARFVCPDGEAKQLWAELALWLEGSYLRSYLMVPEKYRNNGAVSVTENGKMPTVNDKDKQFQDNFNLTLYQMALYHHQTSECIQLKLTPPVEKKLEILPLENVAANEQQAPTLAPQLNNSAVKPLAIIKEYEYLPYSELDRIKDQNEAVQFSMLVSLIKKYKLTDDQNNSLKTYSIDILATLRGYNASYFTSHYVPTFIWARTHSALVTEKIEEIEAVKKPSDQVLVLFDLWQEIKSKGSSDLIGKVNDLLKNAFTILYLASAPPVNVSRLG